MRTVKKRWKMLALLALVAVGMGCPANALAAASKKNVMCAKTNTGKYFPVVRISMMVVADGATTFEIVLKDGQGEAGVQSISFEKHEEMIDFSLYQQNSDGTPYVDLMKPSWVITSTGKYYKTMNVTNFLAKEGSDKFDVVTTTGTEPNVAAVYFLRGTEEQVVMGIDAPMVAGPATENLKLMTPVHQQLSLSGCGNATSAQVYSLDGKMLAEAAAADGNTTIQVGHLPAGVYVVRVGHKALKFTKK
jgi:hypothetical protein